MADGPSGFQGRWGQRRWAKMGSSGALSQTSPQTSPPYRFLSQAQNFSITCKESPSSAAARESQPSPRIPAAPVRLHSNEEGSLQIPPKRCYYRLPHRTQRRLKVVLLSLFAIICIVPRASCIRHHTSSLLEKGVAAGLKSPSSQDSREGRESAAFRLLQQQIAQVEQQEMLEAMAVPFLTPNAQPSVSMRGEKNMADETDPQISGSNTGEFGSVYASGTPVATRGKPGPSLGAGGHPEASSAAVQTPVSFINWGQVGGMLQSPILAHTGVPVSMPRNVVATTIGLDFDSPATFHGPLLVAIMVVILIFFLLLLLCCWMVKSKQEHDKFMAEKIPRA